MLSPVQPSIPELDLKLELQSVTLGLGWVYYTYLCQKCLLVYYHCFLRHINPNLVPCGYFCSLFMTFQHLVCTCPYFCFTNWLKLILWRSQCFIPELSIRSSYAYCIFRTSLIANIWSVPYSQMNINRQSDRQMDTRVSIISIIFRCSVCVAISRRGNSRIWNCILIKVVIPGFGIVNLNMPELDQASRVTRLMTLFMDIKWIGNYYECIFTNVIHKKSEI